MTRTSAGSGPALAPTALTVAAGSEELLETSLRRGRQCIDIFEEDGAARRSLQHSYGVVLVSGRVRIDFRRQAGASNAHERRALRALWRWMSLARRFLPTPYSPTIITRTGVCEASAMSCRSSRAAVLDPTRIPAISPGLTARRCFTAGVDSNGLASAFGRADLPEIPAKLRGIWPGRCVGEPSAGPFSVGYPTRCVPRV